MGGGGCLKYRKTGWKGKERRESKGLRKGGQSGSRGGCLEKGGLETPYKLYITLMSLRQLNHYKKRIIMGEMEGTF